MQKKGTTQNHLAKPSPDRNADLSGSTSDQLSSSRIADRPRHFKDASTTSTLPVATALRGHHIGPSWTSSLRGSSLSAAPGQQTGRHSKEQERQHQARKLGHGLKERSLAIKAVQRLTPPIELALSFRLDGPHTRLRCGPAQTLTYVSVVCVALRCQAYIPADGGCPAHYKDNRVAGQGMYAAPLARDSLS